MFLFQCLGFEFSGDQQNTESCSCKDTQTAAITQLSRFLGTHTPLHYIKMAICSKFWVITERMGSRAQAALMTFFRRMTGLGFKGRLRSVETLDREPPGYFLLKRTQVEVQEHVMWIIYSSWPGKVLAFPGSHRKVLLVGGGCLKSLLPL